MVLELKNREWKDFELGKLFKIYTGGDLIISRIQKGDIPIISHSKANNGVAEWTKPISKQRLFNHKTTISLADRGNFYAYTQKTDFYIGTRVKALEANFPNCNSKILNFICPSINKQAIKFSYGNNATGGVEQLKILLPITTKGEPDFKFMEAFMKQKSEEQIKNYQNYLDKRLAKIKNFKKVESLEEKEWGDFEIGKLFTLSQGKSKGLNHLKKTRDGINYLGATNLNNGVLCQVEKEEKLLHNGNGIAFIRNGEGSMGYSIYKAENFIATSDISVGYNSNLNREIGLFITTVADKVRGKYNFGYKRSGNRLKKEKILLPINDQNEPDYTYMENYIKQLEYNKLKEYQEIKMN